jgi:uncharacterized protein YbjT (DUF2867 family)
MKKTIAVVGASGFVGRALISKLSENLSLRIVAISRRPLPDHLTNLKNVTWRKCDLHSLNQTEEALAGIDCAYYLVHSMTEAVRFRQGSFQDVDLALADHFGRAVQKNDVSKVIYLGGLIPPKRRLSAHLGSRLEVEDVLRYYQPKSIAIRAGIIWGPNGSSSNILVKLVKRFPVLPCPVNANNLCQPIYIEEAVNCLVEALGDSSIDGQSVDIGGPERLSYLKIMEVIADALGEKRKIYVIPFPFPDFTKAILSRVTRSPAGLVFPLFESMKEQMICRKNFHYNQKHCTTTVKEAVNKSIKQDPSDTIYKSGTAKRRLSRNETVRSIQRVNLNHHLSSREIANYYLQFLSTIFIWFLKIKSNHPKVSFHLVLFGTKLLEFEFIESWSRKDRSLFRIRGGLLVKKPLNHARLEFRQIPSNGATLVCVHDYNPRLPWIIYRMTQSLAHTWIIRIFEVWLNAKSIEEDLEENPKAFALLRSLGESDC